MSSSAMNVYYDLSRKRLENVPEEVLKMINLRMLYLEGNLLTQLPETFFPTLNMLLWLDLRNNKLTQIPANIAYHACLETLLIQDNFIKELPNELGLVPNLKRLQFSGNPLQYPSKFVLESGTKTIVECLKESYIKSSVEISMIESEKSEENLHRSPSAKENSLNNIDDANSIEKSKINAPTASKLEISKKSSIEYNPCISVKRLESKRSNDFVTVIKKKPSRMIEKCPKLRTAKTYYNSSKYINALKTINREKQELKVETQELKDMWIKHLKELMNQQSAILQKEKNLQALKNWRQENQSSVRKYNEESSTSNDNYTLEYPYGIDPEYMSILATLNVEKDIKRLLKHSKKPAKKVNMMRIISDIVKELKSLETTSASVERSPRTEVETANKEIMKILEIQKKIDALKMQNEII